MAVEVNKSAVASGDILPLPRSGHTSHLLPDGRMVLCAGSGGAGGRGR